MQRPDADLVRREIEHTAHMMRHAARRGRLAYPRTIKTSPRCKAELDRDAADLIAEQEALWHERSRPGGLQDSLKLLYQMREDYHEPHAAHGLHAAHEPHAGGVGAGEEDSRSSRLSSRWYLRPSASARRSSPFTSRALGGGLPPHRAHPRDNCCGGPAEQLHLGASVDLLGRRKPLIVVGLAGSCARVLPVEPGDLPCGCVGHPARRGRVRRSIQHGQPCARRRPAGGRRPSRPAHGHVPRHRLARVCGRRVPGRPLRGRLLLAAGLRRRGYPVRRGRAARSHHPRDTAQPSRRAPAAWSTPGLRRRGAPSVPACRCCSSAASSSG